MGSIYSAADRQRESIGSNDSQKSLPLLSTATAPESVEPSIVSRCDSMLDAIHLCIYLSRLPHEAICSRLNIDKGHWSRMLQGQAHFPPNKLIPLMELAGNYAPLQWMASACGFELFKDAKQARVAELRAELAKLERAA